MSSKDKVNKVKIEAGEIVVDAPIEQVWEICTTLENFPDFIAGLKSCKPLANGDYQWDGRAFGIQRTWQSSWVKKEHPHLIAWRTDEPMVPSGRVFLEEVGPDRTRVQIEMRYLPQTLLDQILINPIFARARLRFDLLMFARYVRQINYYF